MNIRHPLLGLALLAFLLIDAWALPTGIEEPAFSRVGGALRGRKGPGVTGASRMHWFYVTDASGRMRVADVPSDAWLARRYPGVADIPDAIAVAEFFTTTEIRGFWAITRYSTSGWFHHGDGRFDFYDSPAFRRAFAEWCRSGSPDSPGAECGELAQSTDWTVSTPLVRGYVHNALSASAAAWMLVCFSAFPAWMKERISRRRARLGLCPRCAYDLCHNLAVGCPECGWNREAVK